MDSKHPAERPRIAKPSLLLLAQELRVLSEWPRFRLRTMSLPDLPAGDEHAVMVIPGFGADDFTTRPLRRALSRLGYNVFGWTLGRNLGMRPEIKKALALHLQTLHARYGKVSLIGWSLGGVFARELARHNAEQVRAVYSLGSPINGDPAANNLNALFRIVNRGRPVKHDAEGFARRRIAPPVPCVAIYSKRDGIVAWRCCLEEPAPNTQNIEVHGSHFGLVCNYEVLRALAEHLPERTAATQSARPRRARTGPPEK